VLVDYGDESWARKEETKKNEKKKQEETFRQGIIQRRLSQWTIFCNIRVLFAIKRQW
jgi:hypothetical protein